MSSAKSEGVSVLALTDHDTTIGLARAKRQAKLEGICLIDGIEFSAQWSGCNIHIVGLNFDLNSERLAQAVFSQSEARQQRAVTIGEKLEKLGIPGAYEGALAEADGGVIGRPHFAKYLVDQGVCKNFPQAFKKYLGAGKPGDVKQGWPHISEIVSVIRAAGGVSVLAHPAKYNMTRTKLCALVADFAEAGGQAMEVVSGIQQAGLTQDLAKIANRYKLLASCGSDFHAPGNQWQTLGKFSALPKEVTPVWREWE